MKNLSQTYTPVLNRLIALCGGIIALSLFLYGIFLLEAVAHTASRAQAQQSIHKLATSLSALEMQYLAQTKQITPERAVALGFVSPESGATETILATAAARTLGYSAGVARP